MALLWARRRAIRGGFFCSARRRRRKEKNGRNRASFLPLTSVCVVPRETLIARLLRTLAKVARVSSACFPDSSNNPPPPIPTPPAINRNNRIHVELCVKAPASSRPLKIVFFKIVDGLSEICAQAKPSECSKNTPLRRKENTKKLE